MRKNEILWGIGGLAVLLIVLVASSFFIHRHIKWLDEQDREAQAQLDEFAVSDDFVAFLKTGPHKDRWGNTIWFREIENERKIQLISCGRDGELGTGDDLFVTLNVK